MENHTRASGNKRVREHIALCSLVFCLLSWEVLTGAQIRNNEKRVCGSSWRNASSEGLNIPHSHFLHEVLRAESGSLLRWHKVLVIGPFHGLKFTPSFPIWPHYTDGEQKWTTGPLVSHYLERTQVLRARSPRIYVLADLTSRKALANLSPTGDLQPVWVQGKHGS